MRFSRHFNAVGYVCAVDMRSCCPSRRIVYRASLCGGMLVLRTRFCAACAAVCTVCAAVCAACARGLHGMCGGLRVYFKVSNSSTARFVCASVCLFCALGFARLVRLVRASVRFARLLQGVEQLYGAFCLCGGMLVLRAVRALCAFTSRCRTALRRVLSLR